MDLSWMVDRQSAHWANVAWSMGLIYYGQAADPTLLEMFV